MDKKQGISMITLIITIIVIILIASITIYSGLNTVEDVRIKSAKDATNAIYLALIANESIVPSGVESDKFVDDYDNISNKVFTNRDFELMGLDYSSEDCTVVLNKSLSGDGVTLIYNFTYTDNSGHTYDNLIYQGYKNISNLNSSVEFDNQRGVNRPVFSSGELKPIYYSGDTKLYVDNVYSENWYDYSEGVPKFALAETSDGKVFAWIPRFAFKIQKFYDGQAYKNVPKTAIDIVFLRTNTNYMPNNEVMQNGYAVHPAFSSGESGFWVMLEHGNNVQNIDEAIAEAQLTEVASSHLMKNSEYSAVIFLSIYLNNNQIVFDDSEYVAGVFNDDIENFDVYSLSIDDENYVGNLQGHALLDTPWNYKITAPSLPTSTKRYLIRKVEEAGEFYYQASNGSDEACYRTVISK